MEKSDFKARMIEYINKGIYYGESEDELEEFYELIDKMENILSVVCIVKIYINLVKHSLERNNELQMFLLRDFDTLILIEAEIQTC